MRKTLMHAACGLALTLGTAACGGSTEPISQAELADRFAEGAAGVAAPSGLDSRKLGDCLAEEIYPTLSEDEKKQLNEEGKADKDTVRGILEKSSRAATTCAKKLVPAPSSP